MTDHSRPNSNIKKGVDDEEGKGVSRVVEEGSDGVGGVVTNSAAKYLPVRHRSEHCVPYFKTVNAISFEVEGRLDAPEYEGFGREGAVERVGAVDLFITGD